MTPWVRVDRIRKTYSAFGDLPCIRRGRMYMESLQEESPSGSLQLRLWEILADATWRTYTTLTFQIQMYSSSLGGTTFFLGGSDSPSTAIPSSCASFGSASSSSPARAHPRIEIGTTAIAGNANLWLRLHASFWPGRKSWSRII